MGSKRNLPDTSQLNLIDDLASNRAQNKDDICPPDRFLSGDPHSIFIGDTSLGKYLRGSGKSWVIRFRDLIFKQDIRPFLSVYKSTGRKPYHPFALLGLILYGMQQGRWSLRNLEDLARIDLCAWWICGGLQPDHSTIGDFINMHSQILSEDFFITLTSDLVRRVKLPANTVSGDGTVVEAVSSRLSMLKQEAAQQALEQAEKTDGTDSPRAARCRKAFETVKARNLERKRKGRSKTKARVCPDEPEAVLQPRKDGVKRPGYKPSILADRNRFILGQNVEGASEIACVSPMLEQYHDIFGALPGRSLWDGGYFKLDMLELAVSLDMDLLCNVKYDSKNPFSKSRFSYNEEKDIYICPAGQTLHYHKSGDLKGRPFRQYQCRACNSCDDRTKCTKSKTGRAIIRYEGEELKEAMRSVMENPQTMKRLRYRKAMVEPVFGDLSWRQDLKRFHRRGLGKVRVEFSLHCMSYNLRRAIRLQRPYLICFFYIIDHKNEQRALQIVAIAFSCWKNKLTLCNVTLRIRFE